MEGAEYTVDLVPAGTPPPPSFDAADLRREALTFPANTGTGVDCVSPRATARLSDGILQSLAQLLLAMEREGKWAASLSVVVIALLPKA